MSDFGIAVSPSFRDSALRTVSPRALQVWLVLGAMAAHVPCRREIAGRSVQLQPGDVLIAMRTLRRDIGCGSTQLASALRELAACAAIEVSQIAREAFPNRERQRSQNENAGNTAISRISVRGIKHLARVHSVPKSGTQVRAATASPLRSRKDEQEWQEAQRILAAEGR
jgi:hypothetical protein